ncbi:MAG: hypothetical protein KC474_03015 [Cyanobacteria bacterium HKST-UBA04]|nr:hypothetical protein [Cyanobacteria bacterium HKST-UBA04]
MASSLMLSLSTPVLAVASPGQDTGSAPAATPFLKGILLDSSSGQTRVLLNANQAVPVKVRSQSANRIELELSVHNPQDSIRTDFASAKNIEQVILKPIDATHLKLVIRGNQLGSPSVTVPGFSQRSDRPTSHIASSESPSVRPATTHLPAPPQAAEPQPEAPQKPSKVTTPDAHSPSKKPVTAKTSPSKPVPKATAKPATKPTAIAPSVNKADDTEATSNRAQAEDKTSDSNTADTADTEPTTTATATDAQQADSETEQDSSELDVFDTSLPSDPQPYITLQERQAFAPPSQHVFVLDEEPNFGSGILNGLAALGSGLGNALTNLSKLSVGDMLPWLLLMMTLGASAFFLLRNKTANAQSPFSMAANRSSKPNLLVQWWQWVTNQTPANFELTAAQPKRVSPQPAANNRPVGLRSLNQHPHPESTSPPLPASNNQNNRLRAQARAQAYASQSASPALKRIKAHPSLNNNPNRNAVDPLPRPTAPSATQREMQRSLARRDAIDRSNNRSNNRSNHKTPQSRQQASQKAPPKARPAAQPAMAQRPTVGRTPERAPQSYQAPAQTAAQPGHNIFAQALNEPQAPRRGRSTASSTSSRTVQPARQHLPKPSQKHAPAKAASRTASKASLAPSPFVPARGSEQSRTRSAQPAPTPKAPQPQPSLAQTTGAADGGLQNNTQVLDFLKSVADLMEQDGYNTSAAAIKNQIHEPLNQ